MSQYSFPLLEKRDIRETLGELNIPCTDDDLGNPMPHTVQLIYEQLVELLLSQPREEFAQPSFSGMDHLEHPELHSDSIRMNAFLRAWCAAATLGRCR